MTVKPVGRLLNNTRGNVAIVLALAAVPLLFAVGMGMDYTSASYREDQLNAFADAAALAALTPAILAQSDAASVAAATTTFNAQAASVTGVTYNPNALTVAVNDTSTATSVTRTVTVSYTASSQNAFLGILGSPTISLTGGAQGTAKAAPNINFYLLLDDSPSMAIAATQAGITTMVNNTSSQGGCAFACHESNPKADNLGNPNGEDNYALARNLGVTLRIDLVQQATTNLMTTAQQIANTDNAEYQMAIYSFDSSVNTIQTLTSSLSLAQAAASNISVLEIPQNNTNNDEYTNFESAMTKLNTVMPSPGNGTNAASDTPQEVLFLVTDGVDDTSVNGTRTYTINTAECTTIKNRGIRIAVLYTIYYPLPTNSWYNTYIAPIQSNIGPTLQNCASPGLYQAVDTGGDISSALANLFETAVATAYLSK
jgi:Flp pilus assembly protein TadG